MKNSQKDVYDAILFFAELYGLEKNYKALIEISRNLPSLIEIVILDMFLNKFNAYHCTDLQYENYKIIFEYFKELKSKGFVIFEK